MNANPVEMKFIVQMYGCLKEGKFCGLIGIAIAIVIEHLSVNLWMILRERKVVSCIYI